MVVESFVQVEKKKPKVDYSKMTEDQQIDRAYFIQEIDQTINERALKTMSLFENITKKRRNEH